MKQLKVNPNYAIATDGTVYRNVKPLKPWISSNGYYTIYICKEGTRKSHSIHRLLAETYLPDFWPGCEVDHIDGNKLNNKLDNLKCLEPSHHNSISPKNQYKHCHANNYERQYIWYLFEYNDGKTRRRIYNTKIAIQNQLGFTNKQMCDAITRRKVKGWKAVACKLSSKPGS